MTKWLGIHEELHRMILLNRFLNWTERDEKRFKGRTKRQHAALCRRYARLVGRLRDWRPTWEERETGDFDGVVP